VVVVISPILEEVIRELGIAYSPFCTLAFFFICETLPRLKSEQFTKRYQNALMPFMLHVFLTYVPLTFYARLTMHMLWNFVAVSYQLKMFRKDMDAFLVKYLNLDPTPTELMQVTYMGESYKTIPGVTCRYVDVSQCIGRLTWKAPPNLVLNDLGTNELDWRQIRKIPTEKIFSHLSTHSYNLMYPLLITSGVLWMPANNAVNLLAAVLSRVHRNTEPIEDSLCRGRRQTWTELGKWFSFYVKNAKLKNMSLEEAVREMGSRKHRILRANEEQLKVGTHRSKGITVKWNETIGLKNDENFGWYLRPRAIVNLHPSYHADTAMWAKVSMKWLKKMFEGFTIFNAPLIRNTLSLQTRIDFRYAIGTGRNAVELGRIMDRLQAGAYSWIITAGDDSLAKFDRVNRFSGTQMHGCFIENDMRMCDQSQGVGPLSDSYRQWKGAMGVPEEVLNIYDDQFKGNYKAKKVGSNEKLLEVIGSVGYQLPTGTTATTEINTINVFLGHVFAFQNPDVKFDDSMKHLGFDSKPKFFEQHELYKTTFLKGWFIKDDDGNHVWIPLPSLVLKIGKVLNDPCIITKEKNYILAVAKMAYLISSSMLIDRKYPILGDFLSVFDRLGIAWHYTSEDLEKTFESFQFKPWKDERFSLTPRMVGQIVENIEYRYGLVSQELCRLKRHFENVQALPSIIFDPAFERMRDVDYF
jgi:hypothetical protein